MSEDGGVKPHHGEGFVPPIFTIDLSQEPRDRYKTVARAYQDHIQEVTVLFNDILTYLGIQPPFHGLVNLVARLLLRRLASSVETAEIQGIADVTDAPMYLLVAFNVVLDLLMGCTSGAVKTREPGQPKGRAKMLHFRTLDWTMDPLRSMIVQLEFIRSKSARPSEVIARSITYVGFVGILTGVREGLSFSLNFRRAHHAGSRMQHLKLVLHQLLVLLSFRPSISSNIRQYIVPEDDKEFRPRELADILDELIPQTTTAAYLTLSNGTSTVVLEKDHTSAVMRQSEDFIAVTNHDGLESSPNSPHESASLLEVPGAEDLFAESKRRLGCISSKWESRLCREPVQASEAEGVAVTLDELVDWMSDYPTRNEYTHFATILDPTQGQIVWARGYSQDVIRKRNIE